MRGIRPRAAGPFSDARKGTKSAFKGQCPLKNPSPPGDGGRCTAVQYLTFFDRCAAVRHRMRGIRPRAGVLFVQRCSTLPFLRGVPQAAPNAGYPPPRWGSFCTAVQYLTFFDRCAAGGTSYAGCPPPRWGSFCTAVQYLTFFDRCAASGTSYAGCPPPRGGFLFGCTKRNQKCT